MLKDTFLLNAAQLFFSMNLILQVAKGAAKAVSFPIVPSALGKIDLTVKAQSALASDAIKRQLLVEVIACTGVYAKILLYSKYKT